MTTHLAKQDQLTEPEVELTVTDESQKAWHLFSILLSLGRPAPPHELASLCKLFPASPDLVQFLCQIPHSPIRLTSDLVVTLSLSSVLSFPQFLPDLNLVSVTQPQRVCRTYTRKRKRSVSQWELLPLVKRRVNQDLEDAVQGNCSFLHLSGRIQDAFIKDHSAFKEDGIWSTDSQGSDSPDECRKVMLIPSMANGTGESGWQLIDSEIKGCQSAMFMPIPRVILHEDICESELQHTSCRIEEIPGTASPVISERVEERQPDPGPNISCGALENSDLCENANEKEKDPSERDISETSSPVVSQRNTLSNKLGYLIAGENGRTAEEGGNLFTGYIRTNRESEEPFESEFNKKNEKNHGSLHRPIKSQCALPAVDCSHTQKHLPKPSAKQLKAIPRVEFKSRMAALYESLEHGKAVPLSREKEYLKRSQKLGNTDLKLKHGRSSMQSPEQRGTSTSVPTKDQVDKRVLPDFESYVIEEEEGSGGYGTVYRARRKTDGTTVAIKCPHANAHKHHIVNELRMLERFGGKNFIIKYEGCFKSGNSDCFVLEHVEHDRPEVLKKEIDVLQLQWYGFCLFRALGSLHKQGIVHRDVKPGNFLFSRKYNKGYLIDFNLAMDVHQKYGAKNKLKLGYNAILDPFVVPNVKSSPPVKGGRSQPGRPMTSMKKEEIKVSTSNLVSKGLKRKMMDQTNACNDLGGWTMRSQGADGSGITSTKDTRTTSAERLREPLPRTGRKELISFVQKTRHTNNEVSSVPSPMRKRVAAPPGKMDGKLTIITPMPLHTIGGNIYGAGLKINKGDNKREGPCVGTKGFRAPEVLFRSAHQGPKLDVWSAGVTFLYLVLGRMPFFGDPEQNIKDIAKLRGSEDLWEVAKLHNREPSFPVDLYDSRYLPSTDLREWCSKTTKRADFFDVLPSSFFDLMDKCLTVNPRQRISADEALRHEFFTPCQEVLRKQKLLRREGNPESQNSRPLQRYPHFSSTSECYL